MQSNESAHVRREFRARLAALEPRGLLAVGVRVILEQNGFSPDSPREHCGCPVCRQRCSVCADRQQTAA